jgi:thymidylate synthase
MSAICLIEESLDDLMWAALNAVFVDGESISPTKGQNRELRGVVLELTNPRARLSRSESRGKVFSALGELAWYLSGNNATDQIAYYLPRYSKFDESGLIYGGYGPRLRGGADQLMTVVGLLRSKPSTRRAVIQLFEGADLLEDHLDVPCTCTLQFFNRSSRVDLVVYMRSNDVYIGFPHDVFCFTMIQEIVARAVGADVGTYIHFAGSLHLYDENESGARQFLDAGFHETNEMPPMPEVDPMPSVLELCAAEAQLRSGTEASSVALPTEPYWADLARLLVVFALDRMGRHAEIGTIVQQMTTKVYDVHVTDRLDRVTGNP